MTPSGVLAAICPVALIACTVGIIVGETYHRHRKRRWKKRVHGSTNNRRKPPRRQHRAKMPTE
jgi:hypothetical protein